MIPTVCLLLFLACCISLAWLSTQGLPACAVRFLEQRAAMQGVYLSIDKVRLAPMRGVAARAQNVRLYTDADHSDMLGSVREAAVGINLGALLTGQLCISFAHVADATLFMPVTAPAETDLPVRIENVELRTTRDGLIRIANGRVNIMGVPVKLAGSLDPAVLTPRNHGAESLNIPKLINEYQGTINSIYSTVHNQQWKPEEIPSMDVRADWRTKPRIALHASVPRYDIGSFHFRDVVADLGYNKEVITINSLNFRTEDPDALASLQGGYDMGERHLAFNMRSTVALMRMIHRVSHPRTREFLGKFHHPDSNPPNIKLGGDVVFEKDFTLRSARVRGHVSQKNLTAGSTKIDEIELSFFYDNGDFNIDKLELRFPDGSLQALASAKNRAGQAQLAANMPIQKVLTLVNEFSSTHVELPRDMELGKRVNLQLQAQLDAPSFKPGQDEWQDFVPTIHMIGAWLSTDTLSYNGYLLDRPRLQIQLDEIQQKANYVPEVVRQMKLSLEAAVAKLPAGDTKRSVRIVSPCINADVSTITFNEDGLPNDAESVVFSSTADILQYELGPVPAEHATERQDPQEAPADDCLTPKARAHDEQLSLRTPQLQLMAKKVHLDSYKKLDTLDVQEAQVQIKISDLHVKDLQVGSGEILASGLRQVTPLGSLNRLFSAGQLQANFDDVKYGEREMGKISLSAGLSEYTSGHAVLKIDGPNDQQPCLVSAKPNWSDPQQIVLEDVQMQVPGGFLEALLHVTGTRMDDIEVPELVRAGGRLRLSPRMLVQEAKLHVEIPNLVRTPQRVTVFQGKRIPLSLSTDAAVQRTPDNKNLLYDVRLKAMHSTGSFIGRITGSTAGNLQVNGHNTIRPDIIDQLIDNKRAHSVIRDFRFTDASRATISDISVQVNYTNGIRVDSFCRTELRNTEYQMSVLLDNPDGTERVRTDVGPNPYTLVNLATCDVAAHVLIGCKTPQGSPIPDETVVTISNPTLFYNNEPWLRRNKWKNGPRETKLSGESVIIDVERSFVELNKVGGTVYPSYSLGMFYPELYGFLEDVVLPLPALVQTNQCVFPIYDDCERPMSGVISVRSEKNAGFRFIGATIPLDEFSGFISLSDDAVLLDRMNALSWEGVINAMVRIGIHNSGTTFDGVVRANCMNMRKIASAYKSQQSDALCSGEIRFRSPDANLNSMTAYGRVDIEDGDLMSLSLFRPVGEMITDLPKHLERMEKQARGEPSPESRPGFFMRLFSSIFRGLGKIVGRTGGSITSTASNIPGMNHLIAYDLKEAHANFQIANGHIFTRNMKATGSNLNVHLNADIDLNTLEVHGNLWPKISSLPTILLSPVTVLSDFMMDIVIYGPLNDVKWRIALDRSIKKRKPRQAACKKGEAEQVPAAAH